jgi:hypothetical protein
MPSSDALSCPFVRQAPVLSSRWKAHKSVSEVHPAPQVSLLFCTLAIPPSKLYSQGDTSLPADNPVPGTRCHTEDIINPPSPHCTEGTDRGPKAREGSVRTCWITCSAPQSLPLGNSCGNSDSHRHPSSSSPISPARPRGQGPARLLSIPLALSTGPTCAQETWT